MSRSFEFGVIAKELSVRFTRVDCDVVLCDEDFYCFSAFSILRTA